MNCLEALNISAGVTSVIGSGGKTTLLRALADELHQAEPEARIVLATTTHFLPFEGIKLYEGADEGELSQLLAEYKVVCVGRGTGHRGSSGDQSDLSPLASSKLGPSPISMERLAQLADYVLVEADGSKRLPLKAHAEHEPVVLDASNQTILVLGASGFWQPIQEVAHRPELFCELTGTAPTDEATPALAGQAIAAEIASGKVAPTKIVINQMDSVSLLQTPEVPQLEEAITKTGFNLPIFGASIQAHRLWLL